jgi:ZIP family zinc transporter
VRRTTRDDGVPESLVLGLSIAPQPAVSIAFVGAVAISNIPQGLGGSAGMLTAGWSKARITRLWVAVCIPSVIAAATGYVTGELVPGSNGSSFDAFAAGALLVMLTDSMIPEAFQHAKRDSGLALVLGFGVALALTVVQLG